MGATLRIFFVDDDDSLHRIPIARFNRLNKRDPAEHLPRFAGKRVRCAIVILETAGRDPLTIEDILYSIILFDKNGRIDTSRDQREMRLAAELMAFPDDEQKAPQIIDAKQHFLKRQYAHEFKWKPTRELEEAIVEAVFSQAGKRR
jgi:hypothetical protein